MACLHVDTVQSNPWYHRGSKYLLPPTSYDCFIRTGQDGIIFLQSRYLEREKYVTVQPCIFLPAYRGQEACGIRLMKILSKKHL